MLVPVKTYLCLRQHTPLTLKDLASQSPDPMAWSCTVWPWKQDKITEDGGTSHVSERIYCVFAAYLSGGGMNNEKCISWMTFLSLFSSSSSSPHLALPLPGLTAGCICPCCKKREGRLGGYGPAQIVWRLIPGCSDYWCPRREINHSIFKLVLNENSLVSCWHREKGIKRKSLWWVG